MGGRLLNAVAHFLTLLEATQQELLKLFERKRAAIKQGHVSRILQLAEEESRLVQQLQQHLQVREELLQTGLQAGYRVKSLTELVETITGGKTGELYSRLQRVRERSAELRRESWVQWIVAQRSYKQYADLLDLIAHRGETAPTYETQRSGGSGSGALLDTSA